MGKGSTLIKTKKSCKIKFLNSDLKAVGTNWCNNIFLALNRLFLLEKKLNFQGWKIPGVLP